MKQICKNHRSLPLFSEIHNILITLFLCMLLFFLPFFSSFPILFIFICAFINRYVFVFLVGRSGVDGIHRLFSQHSCSAVQVHCPPFSG